MDSLFEGIIKSFLALCGDGSIAVKNIKDGSFTVHGTNIRLSAMDLSMLSQNKISLMTSGEIYLSAAIVPLFAGHTRLTK